MVWLVLSVLTAKPKVQWVEWDLINLISDNILDFITRERLYSMEQQRLTLIEGTESGPTPPLDTWLDYTQIGRAELFF